MRGKVGGAAAYAPDVPILDWDESKMGGAYYEHIRREIRPLLPEKAHRIVDVGCGAGATLGWLREIYPEAERVGLESNAAVAGALKQNADEAHIVDLDEDLPDLGSPDLMLFLDVLEHLSDPVSVLTRLTSQLVAGGTIIVSLPNVAHYSVSLPLLLFGRFRYADAGILDRTHLHFFVRESAVDLLGAAGFSVDRGLVAGISGPKSKAFDIASGSLFRRWTGKQFIMRGRAMGSAATAPVHWARA